MAAGLHWLGVTSLARALRAGRVSAVAAIAHHLERIERFDGALRAFTHVDRAGALAAAAESAARIEAGTARPLEGVPVAIKGNLDVAGWAVSGGVGALRGRVAERDSQAVARLRAAGAVLIGQTNLHEAALGASTDNPFFGQTQNPHRAGYTAGGSSGGSGAAVAAGFCAAALGTDTLGSIRIPAAHCGIVGLKPGFGRVPAGGLLHLVERWDCVGPMARSVADTAALFDALADPGAEARPLARVATLSSTRQVPLEPAVESALHLARSLLEGLGLRVEEQQAQIDHSRVRLAGFIEAAQEAASRFGPDLARDPEGFSPLFRANLAFAGAADAAARQQGRRAIESAAQAIRATLRLADAILLPATPQPAFRHGGDVPVTVADFTALANFAGLPALALPAGWTADGLPVSVQLVGRAGEEASLLALGERLEAALNAWRPPAGYG